MRYRPPLSAALRHAARDARRLIRKEPGALGHWLWDGPVKGDGYPYVGQVGHMLLVSRVLWADEYGDPPDRLRAACEERCCVKPDHRVQAAGAGPLVPLPAPRPPSRPTTRQTLRD